MSVAERLVEKSKEAFIMAIEIYNKPTLRYRLEGFSFFICNAWELMLKAYIINRSGEEAIYYPDKPNRTISLEKCIQKVFTNDKAPLRKNLEKLIELRNTSTHFITEEYETVYIPLLQACVFNYVDRMQEFHGIDITEEIPNSFLTLPIKVSALDENIIRAKYTSQVSEKLITIRKDIDSLIEANNSRFAIRLEHYYYNTKDRNKATEFYHIEKEAAEGVRLVKELRNPNESHKYNAKACIKELNKRIEKEGLDVRFKGETATINQYHFRNITSYFGIKENEKMCFVYEIQSQPQYSYSQYAIDFIFAEIRKAPATILDDMKAKKQPTPGA